MRHPRHPYPTPARAPARRPRGLRLAVGAAAAALGASQGHAAAAGVLGRLGETGFSWCLHPLVAGPWVAAEQEVCFSPRRGLPGREAGGVRRVRRVRAG